MPLIKQNKGQKTINQNKQNKAKQTNKQASKRQSGAVLDTTHDQRTRTPFSIPCHSSATDAHKRDREKRPQCALGELALRNENPASAQRKRIRVSTRLLW